MNKKDGQNDNKKSVKTAGSKKEPLADVSDLAKAAGIPAWETAAMMAACGWAEGKQVSQSDFDKALAAFRRRGQGSGTINV